MAAASGAPDTNWRPYWATGVSLAAAMALNLYTGNRLWFWYTVIGMAGFLFLLGFVRTLHWKVPDLAVWFVGLAAGLHYVGGSLSGLHQVGGPNGLYYVFPWWDNVVHFIGAAAVAVAACAVLDARLPGIRGGGRVFLSISIATLAGVAIELYEFAGFLWFGTVDQGYYTNTVLDLYYNLLGSFAGAVVYARLTPGRPAQPASPRPVDPVG